MKLAVIYTFLALISMGFNFCGQEVTTRLYGGPYAFTLSMIVGTGIGLLVKYILDKHYIFRFKAQNAAHDTQTFILYTFMGVATTVIFWGFEYAFEFLFHTKEARYIGGVIGLGIGYFVKYRLDKRFVFRQV